MPPGHLMEGKPCCSRCLPIQRWRTARAAKSSVRLRLRGSPATMRKPSGKGWITSLSGPGRWLVWPVSGITAHRTESNLQVVDGHATNITVGLVPLDRNRNEATVLRMVVKFRSPVVGQIFPDVTGRAFGRAGLLEVYGEAEAVTTGNDVDVGRNLVRVNNRIYALVI